MLCSAASPARSTVSTKRHTSKPSVMHPDNSSDRGQATPRIYDALIGMRPTSFLDTATSGVLCCLRGRFALRASESLLRFLPELTPPPAATTTSLPLCDWWSRSCSH